MRYIELSKNVVISESAYSTVVYYAVCEIEEVVFSKVVKKEITERQLKQIVSLEMSDSGVDINVNVELCYGHNLEDVSKKIQKNVVDVVEHSIGYKPSSVNVNVTRISVC